MPKLDAPGASLYYETDGTPGAPALLLIHAGVATLRMWDPQVPALSADHFVIRFDTRGFGLTDAEGVAFSDRADALAILDALGVQAATVIGCSRGGSIAIDLALEFPERVTGLVTVGSGPSGHPKMEETARENELFLAIEAATGAEALHLEADLWSVGPSRDVASVDAAFVATARALNAANLVHVGHDPQAITLDPPAYGRLGDIRVPTLVMVGDFDLSFMRVESQTLVKEISDAESVHFPDAAHLPSVEHPEEFERVLSEWLAVHGL
jgi:3-oxoadipate enol-lactonase